MITLNFPIEQIGLPYEKSRNNISGNTGCYIWDKARRKLGTHMLIPLQSIIDRYKIKPVGCLHIGGNRGEEAEAYHKANINHVMWFEANPDICSTLKENVKKYSGHRAMNFCIGDEDGKEVTFHVSNNEGQSSSILELGTHKKQHPTVHYVKDIHMQTHRIDTLLKLHDWDLFPMDFLNIDLQCAELMALRGMGELLHKFKWAYIEINKAEVYKGCPHVNDIDLFLNGFGFKRVETAKWIGDWTDALYIKK